jgi:hemerythrin-like domain-containing protein
MATLHFNAPTAGFDEPLQMWRDCHRRVRRMTQLLQRLALYLQTHAADETAQVSATSVLRYFTEAGPRHHADEEEDLFPRLLAYARRLSAGPAVDLLASVIERLQDQHRELDALWGALRGPLHRIAAGTAAPLDERVVAAFADGYARHIDLEESEIGPALERLLPAEELALIGAAMAQRRGVPWADGLTPS